MAKALTLKEQLQRKQRLIEAGVIGDPVDTTEDAGRLLGSDAMGVAGTVSHRGDPIVIMYDADGRRRKVPEGSVRALLTQGLALYCPHCEGLHEEDHPNACPALDPVRYRQCPVCGKRIYDERGAVVHNDDPNAIPTEMPSTPEARTQARMEAHILAFHETQARMMGIRAPAEGRVGAGR